jgi:hypothetical protein
MCHGKSTTRKSKSNLEVIAATERRTPPFNGAI